MPPKETTPPVPAETKATSSGACRHCSSANVEITHGKYGYYYKCQACQGNTPIDLNCGKCGAKSRVKKSEFNFTKLCGACGTEELFHRNSAK